MINNNINNSQNNFISPSLQQANQFQKYQIKIKNNKKNNDNNASFISKKKSFKENFKLMNEPTNVTQQAENVYNNTDITPSQQASNQQLINEYNNLLAQYQNSLKGITNVIQAYYNRTDSNNPYAGQNIRFSDSGDIFYVTQMGLAKWYSGSVWESLASNPNSFPNCPNTSNVIEINIPWSSDYLNPGTVIPTNPSLIVGTPMVAGQSCGNEGKNIIVNSLVGNSTATFLGNYNDSTTPLMTSIGGNQNSNFESCQEQALLSGNSLFSLQNANSSTGLGSCNVSNNLTEATSLGMAQQATPVVLWSSNTASLGGVSASLTSSGTLAVYDSNSNIVFQSPSPIIAAPPSNSIAAIVSNNPPPAPIPIVAAPAPAPAPAPVQPSSNYSGGGGFNPFYGFYATNQVVGGGNAPAPPSSNYSGGNPYYSIQQAAYSSGGAGGGGF